jgi:hypothetical protein
MSTRLLAIAVAAISFTACEKAHPQQGASWESLAQVEAAYGKLVTAGNHPTPHQYGTGERVGFFRDANGEVWGLPLTVETDGAMFICAPRALRAEPVTDTFPASSTIIGLTNEPTGWRGGTGNLELLLRDSHGNIQRLPLAGAQLTSGSACWAPQSPGPPQQLHYYRLSPRA